VTRILLTIAACVGILAVAGAAIGVIYLTEPQAQQEGTVKRTAMLVQVTPAEHGTFQPTLVALGSVRPERDVVLQPRVSGQILEVGADFLPGRVVSQGDVLVRIDPADARNQLAQRRAELEQAQAALALERGRQTVARIERDQIQGELSADQEALILREPQLQSTQAQVASARAAVKQAELDLARTTVRAPFNALVLERSANVGSQVSPSVPLGRLVGVDQYWVELTLPASRLRHLQIDPDGQNGSPVRVRDRGAWPPDTTRQGVLTSVVRQVDDQTRLARLLVRIDDPLALSDSTRGPELLAGAWVEARIDARELRDVVRIRREHLRKGDTVWEMVDGKLTIRQVTVELEDAEHAYITEGLEPGASVVTTDLSTVTEGAPLRTEGE